MFGRNHHLFVIAPKQLYVVRVHFIDFEQAKNAVERRADIMRHAGKEVRFGRVRRAGFVRQPLAFPLRRLCAGRRLAKLLLLALQHGVLFLQFAVKNLFRFQLFERVRLPLKRNALRRVVFANPAHRHIQQQQNAAERAEELKQNLRFPGSNGKRRRIALLPQHNFKPVDQVHQVHRSGQRAQNHDHISHSSHNDYLRWNVCSMHIIYRTRVSVKGKWNKNSKILGRY